jgi:hypothetical protein
LSNDVSGVFRGARLLFIRQHQPHIAQMVFQHIIGGPARGGGEGSKPAFFVGYKLQSRRGAAVLLVGALAGYGYQLRQVQVVVGYGANGQRGARASCSRINELLGA